ncbi:MAG: ATP-binding cassette domain-containing protein [Acidimicrobiales bacterium]
MAPEPAVVADNLVKVFQGKRVVRALDGVSFSVERATVLGLLGPNGAGKTTAVRILTTILPPDAGHGRVLGHDVAAEADVVRRLIGLAGQYATVDENLTARENLRMVGRLSHMQKAQTLARADELLSQFDLTDAAHRPLKTYSGGMRRRLDLAAALMGRPPVLFLDEPTTGLDPQSRQGLWGIIEALVEDGTTVLLTTQYLEEADRLASKIVVVDNGRVIAEGTPAELKAELGATVITVTVADADTAARTAGLISPLAPREPVVDGSTVALTVERGAAVATEVLRTLDQQGVEVLGLAMREPSLDDVFLRLTGHHTDQGEEEGAEGGAEGVGTEAGAEGGRRGRRRGRTPRVGRRRGARDAKGPRAGNKQVDEGR